MTNPGLASPLSLKTFPLSSACLRKDKSAPTAYSWACRSPAWERKSRRKSRTSGTARSIFLIYVPPPLHIALVNRNDLPLLCQSAAALRLLHCEPRLSTHAAVHVQYQTARAIHKTKVAIPHRHNVPFQFLRVARRRLNDDVPIQKRTAGVIQHVRCVPGSWIEARDLKITVVVAGDAPLLAQGRISRARLGVQHSPSGSRALKDRQNQAAAAVDELVAQCRIEFAAERVEPRKRGRIICSLHIGGSRSVRVVE